ncbi:MAG: 3-deoxy-7-phosphoheptulonate synthase [Pseudomonadales bacterium]|nr:3-deoxy-7-phosphoheptulonate synthase [Pseudomonadales bacterium]
MNTTVEDLNVLSTETLVAPVALKEAIPATEGARQVVSNARLSLRRILAGEDHRLFVIVGPCSIHDVGAAMEYAERLKVLTPDIDDTLLPVMRVYFEKPRTTIGWKGLINDPYMNDTFNIVDGLHMGRKLLVDLAEMGVPTSTEALDPVTPQYLQDMIAWSAIGARTTESQTHREMASGLSSPIGFKNGTDGGLEVAINALKSVSAPHRFLGINHQGEVSVIHTRGNRHAHIVLRGGSGGANYDSVNVALCEEQLAKAGVSGNIMIDCSHANSNKNHELQPLVIDNVANQILDGNQSIIGLMIESHLNAGNQAIPDAPSQLLYGVSVTDACIDWDTTEQMLRGLRDKVREVLPTRRTSMTDDQESA